MRLSTKARAGLLGVASVAVFGIPSSASAGTYDWRDVGHPTVTVSLAGVAAPDAHEAWAVGQRLTDDRRLVGYAEHLTGSGWSEVTLPGNDYHTFTDVAAGSSRDVWVLVDTHGQGQLFQHWNGTAWSEVPPAAPSGSPGQTALTGVAALPGGTAWAVGFDTVNYPHDTVVQHWDGVRWQQVPTPGQHVELQAVSAVADDDVWAVGWLDRDGFGTLTAMHWDGTGWHTSTIPVPGRYAQLMDVAAVSGTEVWAAGVVEGVPVAMRWNGARWTVLPQPAVDTANVAAVAPDGRGGVWLAGDDYSEDTASRTPLYLHWNGHGWVRATGQQPVGAVLDLAPGATDARSMWAVGTTTSCECFVGQPLVQTHGPVGGRS
ncbi:MAG: hypothetical protein WCA46_02495 [Actinocatenispora sp.]